MTISSNRESNERFEKVSEYFLNVLHLDRISISRQLWTVDNESKLNMFGSIRQCLPVFASAEQHSNLGIKNLLVHK